MTLSPRHRIRNLNPGGLRPSMLPLGHGGPPQYWLSHVDGEWTFFVSFKPPRPGTEPRTLAWKAAVLTTTLGPPPYLLVTLICTYCILSFVTLYLLVMIIYTGSAATQYVYILTGTKAFEVNNFLKSHLAKLSHKFPPKCHHPIQQMFICKTR